MPKKYENHPLAEIFPESSGDKLRELALDIQDNGLIEPITLLHGLILDGRSRYQACLVAKVTPQFVEFDGESPARFVYSKNFYRRDLSLQDRAIAGAKMVLILAAEAKVRQRLGKTLPATAGKVSGEAADLAGQAAGVSGDSVSRAGKVLDKGTPELKDAIKNGKVSLSAGARLANLTPAEQVSAINGDMKRTPTRGAELAQVAEAVKLLKRARAKLRKIEGGDEWIPGLNRVLAGVEKLLAKA